MEGLVTQVAIALADRLSHAFLVVENWLFVSTLIGGSKPAWLFVHCRLSAGGSLVEKPLSRAAVCWRTTLREAFSREGIGETLRKLFQGP